VTFNVYLESHGDFTSLVGGDKKKLSKLPEKLSNCQPLEICDTVVEIWEVKKRHTYNMMCNYTYNV